MTTYPESVRIGKELADFADREAEFSAQRGIVEELFPYIYHASKRMSTRAISRWLAERHRIKLSAVTIAKALREADKFWAATVEEVAPAAQIVAAAHGVSVSDVLLDREVFAALRRAQGKPIVVAGAVEYAQYETAAAQIEEWFTVMNDDALAQCAPFILEESGESEEESEGEPHAGNGRKG